MTVLDFSGYDDIPQHAQYELCAWVEKGYFPGSFLTAVLCNNLFGAIGSADGQNMEALRDITTFVYDRVPADAWGSAAKMRDYAKKVWDETSEG